LPQNDNNTDDDEGNAMMELLRRLFGLGGSETAAAPPMSPGTGTGIGTGMGPAAAPAKPAAPASVASSASEPASEPAGATRVNGTARYVIVGAGPAGVIAAATLREKDREGSIVLVHGEPGEPYSRMAIPYVLTGQIGQPGMTLHKDPGWYADHAIDVRHGRVSGVDVAAKQLAMQGGGRLGFEQLLIATGSSPLRPPIEGLDLPGVHPCWTAEDCTNIVRLAEPGAHVILLGAGFIGCIVLEALAERGVSLTVVEMGDRMVPRMLDAVAGTMLKRWCESKGISVRTSTRITKIEPAAKADKDDRDSLLVDLDDGSQLPANLVVIAAGVRANTGFLDGSGITVDQGILVDDHLRSSVPFIYAAGDVAQGPDFSTRGFSVHAVQPTAADHGRFAAVNMAGGDARYGGSLVMNVLDTVGLVSCSFGTWQGVDGGEAAAARDEAGFKYINLQFDGDHVIGGQAVGRTDWIGTMRGLIQTKVPLGPWKQKLMHDPHRIAEAYLARAGQ
jgi:NAD(P)H-nitrite reductase large subunit